MTYFQSTTDASQFYRASSAAEGRFESSAAVSGNFSDVMKNATIVHGVFVAPPVISVTTAVETVTTALGW